MESLIFMQEDLDSRLSKARANFKKTPKDRLCKDYVESKLDALEKIWGQFGENHVELLKTSDPKILRATNYLAKDTYGEAEERYVDYKCILKAALAKYEETEQFSECITNGKSSKASNAKLPKIVIPKFSGNYGEWSAFRELFTSLVHNADIEAIQKMQYLKGLLSGEAEQLVRHISLSAGNYSRCWETLEARYNNKRYICNNILKRLFSQRASNVESASSIRDLLDTTSECLGALASIGVDVSTWGVIIVYITASKLDHESRKQWELQSATFNDLPTWKSFEEFLTNRFRALEVVDSGASNSKSRSYPPKTFHVAEESENKTTISCKFCKEPHRLANCKQFVNAEVQTRRGFIEKNDLCFNCLGDKHRAKQCRSLSTCRVCHRRHHTYLHPTSTDSEAHRKESGGSLAGNLSEETANPVVCFASGGMAPSSQVLLATALVRAQSSSGDTRIIRALLDQGSQASFVTEATAQYLGLKRTRVRGVISGLEGRTNVSCNSMVNMKITSIYDSSVCLNLNSYIIKSITNLLPSKEVVVTDWGIGNLQLADPKYCVPNKIDILLGAAIYGQIVREGVKKNPEGTLLAQNTTLGWILSGVVSNEDNQEANLISMHMCVEETQLKRIWELESEPISSKAILTEEEMRCEKSFAETTARDQEGRYILKLPFKTEEPDLKADNSKGIANKRLELLDKIRENGKGIDSEEGLKLKVDEVMKLLGLTWNRTNHAFQYIVTLPQLKEPVTKRTIISDIARLFDPWGWVAPSVIVAKAIIQKLWISGIDWDEVAPRWRTYRSELPTLSSLRIPRWIQTSEKNVLVELHGFSDASKMAYAAAVYMRVIDEKGDIHVNLVTAKTKVAPIKQVLIPRLELCGAVLVTRLLLEVAEVLKTPKENIHAWTDSTIVLAWLNSHPNRWQTFVANRVSEILTTLDTHQWSHIQSKQNPADCASRGLTPSELKVNDLWYNGPQVLYKEPVIYTRLKDEETKIEEIKVHLVINREGFWDRFSNLDKMVRIIAYYRRFLMWKKRKDNKDSGYLTTHELKEAKEVCIRECQQENFSEEIKTLDNRENGKAVKLRGPLRSLNPFVDGNRILRGGGRFASSALAAWSCVVVKHIGVDNLTRVVSLRTKIKNLIKRPISKLYVLPLT